MTDDSAAPTFAEGLASHQDNIVDMIARKRAADATTAPNPGASFEAGVIYVGAVVQTMLILLVGQGLIPRANVIKALAAIRAEFEMVACMPECEISLLLAQASAQIAQLMGEVEKVPESPALDLNRLSAAIAGLHGSQIAASMTINSIMLMSIAGGAIEVPTAKKWIKSLSKIASDNIDCTDSLQAVTGEALQTKFRETLEHLDNAAEDCASVDGALIDPSLADGVMH